MAPSAAGLPKVTPVPVPKPGAMSSIPQPQAGSGPATQPAANKGAEPATSTSATFGVLAPSETTLQDAASGPHRDGRIRNPVPSKLKGKTDGSKGNFSVMHLDVAGRTEATERDALAKRTSESTEAAAKRAFESGYVSLRRSRFVQVQDESAPASALANPYALPPAPAPAAPNLAGRRTPLSAEETKSEQARLLTLLRSLHPVLVVDQICKALAFFGGIPGAPPPSDGVFPQSAEANGSGSLFVGWISEIFPKLGGNAERLPSNPASQLDGAEPVKRRRGRPKGSKATKARKDKGMKKGPLKTAAGATQPQPQPQPQPTPASAPAAADESWVDVEEGVLGVSDDVDANVMLLAQATSPRPVSPAPQTEVPQPAPAGMASSARNALPPDAAGNDVSPELTANAKKRGRPKGSKNRAKDTVELEPLVPAPPEMQASQTFNGPAVSESPHVSALHAGTASSSFTPVNTVAATSTRKKAGRAAAGSAHQATTAQLATSGVAGTVASGFNDAGISFQTQPIVGNNTQPTQQLHQAGQPVPHSQVTNPTTGTTMNAGLKASGAAGQKRKRKTAKASEALPIANPTQANGLDPSPSQGTTQLPSATNVVNTQPQASPTVVGAPPAKRQRKAKEPKAPTAKQKAQAQTSANVATGTSAPVAANILSPTTAPNPAPMPVPQAPMVQAPAALRGPEPVQGQSSAPEPTMPSIHSPEHNHFEVQSPTMENYEAQLQAQLEQQNEPEPPPPTHSQMGSGRLANAHLQPQQTSQLSQQQHQQPQMPAAQMRSPNPASAQVMKQQSASPMISQHQVRTTQAPYSQYRTTNTQYGQQHQQNYGSPQQKPLQQSQFTAQQQAVQVAAQAAQVQAQAQQYSTNNQRSFSTTQQYSNAQQLASQQRYQQQLATTSAGTSSYAAQHSPQYGASTTNTFTSTANDYRTAPTTLTTPSYATTQRSQSAAPVTASAYRTTAASNGLAAHHSPSFSNASQQRSASASHTTSQAMQGMGSFSGSTTTDWGLFDTSGMDSSGNQGALGMNNAGYGVGQTNARAQSNAGTGFSTGGLPNFDTSGLGGNERYLQRR